MAGRRDTAEWIIHKLRGALVRESGSTRRPPAPATGGRGTRPALGQEAAIPAELLIVIHRTGGGWGPSPPHHASRPEPSGKMWDTLAHA